MGKTLRALLLFLAVIALFLNFSHAARKPVTEDTLNVLYEMRKEAALDVFKIAYNLHTNGTYFSNIMSYELGLSPKLTRATVELQQTTCTRDKSDLDECAFKSQLYRKEDNYGRTKYINLNPRNYRCRKFLSELDHCPFDEQADLKKEECSFLTNKVSPQKHHNYIEFKCRSV